MKPSYNRISLRGVRTFCVAARDRSFRRAAEVLYLTPSAISHQIRSLENELQVKLFDRSSAGLSLTEAGRKLFYELDPLIREIDDIAGRFQKRYRDRSLRVSVQPFFASELFVPRLSTFLALNPELSIQVDTEDTDSSKQSTVADLTIRLFTSAPADLEADRLFAVRLVAACSPGLRGSLDWHPGRPLKEVPLIIQSERPNAWEDYCNFCGIELGEPSTLIRLEMMNSVVRAAEEGVGVALVPLPLSQRWFQTGKLVRLVDRELVTRDCYFSVVRNENINRSEPVSALRHWVLNEFSGLNSC